MTSEISSGEQRLTANEVEATIADIETGIGIWIGSNRMQFEFPRDECSSKTIYKLADRLSEMAAATLLCARWRGDDDGDPPGTYGDANEAGEFLLRFSIEMRSGAGMVAAFEAAHKAEEV